jgi:hypothetical protein
MRHVAVLLPNPIGMRLVINPAFADPFTSHEIGGAAHLHEMIAPILRAKGSTDGSRDPLLAQI